MWEAAVAVLLVGAGVGFSILQRRGRLQAWGLAAEACGLRVISLDSRSGLRARAGTLEVSIEESGEKHYPARLTVTLPPTRGLRDVRIHPESLIRLPWVQEIEIGDRKFDGAFTIQGPPRLVFALLDSETRGLLSRLSYEGKVEISDGALRVLTDHSRVDPVLPVLLAIGRQLLQALDGPQRIADNARRDPEAEVRLRCLLCLTRELPGHPITIDALHTACSDLSPEIRLRAALELGEEGRDTLFALAESTEHDDTSAQAIRTLDRDLAFERTAAILHQALRRRFVKTALACVEAVGLSGHAEAIDTLAKVMAIERGEIAAAAALALGASGSAQAEPLLIEALERDQADLRIAAASALARVGSVAAVLPLKELSERPSQDGALRRAARQTIAEIQSRLQGASPGQLSLAGHEAGQLSLAEADAGQLSLATDAAGRLSLRGSEKGLKPSPGGSA